MSARFKEAFILAAGEGTRMRPFTLTQPKPMAVINGQTLIQRIIEQCRLSGIDHIYANKHHLADILDEHIGDQVTLLHENTLLDSGLGVKKALPMMSGNPFYIINGDSWWQDTDSPVFDHLDAAWDDALYDLILVLQRVDHMHITPGVGDYAIVDGRPVRSLNKSGTHMFTSIRLCHPRLFANTPDTPFSFLLLMDKAEKEGRLGAIELQGTWHHLSTVEDVRAVNAWRAKT